MFDLISEDSLRRIIDLFNGDAEEDLFTYKTGSTLVKFFNNNFGFQDSYGQGFPSRWMFTLIKLTELIDMKKVNSFFTLILSKRYLMSEKSVSEVDAVVLSEKILHIFNQHLKADGFVIIKKNDTYELTSEDEDLVYVGEGGFALVYRRKSNGVIVKKLKEEFLLKKDIKSRFKREYDITKSLNDIHGIIEVYAFNAEDYSYTMKYAEQSLHSYITDHSHTFENQLTMLRQVLYIIDRVHTRNIVHRDISPQNILIISGMLHVSDFGLGKDLDMFHSHRTTYTNSFGQFSYCAPEQFMQLKDGDKQSDVYSLGKLINFIITSNPNNYNHIFRSVTEKATNENPHFRYIDAKQLLAAVEKTIAYYNNTERIKVVKEKIEKSIYDEDIENYIYGLKGVELSTEIITSPKFIEVVMKFIESNDKRSLEIINLVEESYRECCKTSFSSYDSIAQLAYRILNAEGFSYVTKETAANVLYSIAYEVNRFNAQNLVGKLLDKGIEPMIEDILNG